MKIVKMFALALSFLAALTATGGEEITVPMEPVVNSQVPSEEPVSSPVEGPLYSSVLPNQDGDFSDLAAGRETNKPKKSTITHSKREAKFFCEEFDIDCGGGKTDDCCGSLNSCLSYCEEFCEVEACEVAN